MKAYRPHGLVALALSLIAATVSAQSLGDVAKRTADARAKKAAAATPATPGTSEKAPDEKVYTNKDLRETPPDGVLSHADPTPVATAVAPVTRPAPASLALHDEPYWKNRMRSVLTQLQNDQTFLAAAVVRERALGKQLHQDADNTAYVRDRIQRGVLEDKWQAAVTEVGLLKAQVVNDTRAQEDLELEAHRAGVPPGWIIIK